MRKTAACVLAAAACAYAVTSDRAHTDDLAGSRLGSERTVDTAALEGVWRSRGYGWVMVIQDGQARFYDESASLCIRSDESNLDVDQIIEPVDLSQDGRTLRMPISDPAYQYTFDRLNALPAACGKSPSSTPDAVLDAVIEMFSTHYAFFDTRNVDWRSLSGEARHDLATEASEARLLEVVGNLVSRVGDAHVSLEAERNGRWVVKEGGDGRTLEQLALLAARENLSAEDMRANWESSYWNSGIADVLLGGEGTFAANGQIAYGMIDSDIGYLAVRSMEGFAVGSDGPEDDAEALDRAMDDAIAMFGSARAVIVDISINDGGYDTVARALAGRFAAERTLAYYKYAGDAGTHEPQAIHVEPSVGPRFTGPVYLVTSDVSVSAAEILTMAMRALPNVTHVGEATRGALSDILSKRLPNGWSLSLSNEVYVDADGKRWEGAGIQPDIVMDVFLDHDVTKGHVEAVQSIVDGIRRDGVVHQVGSN